MNRKSVTAQVAALRAAVTAALWQARTDRYLLALNARSRAVLIDDLCRYLSLTGVLGVGDLDLARAAADAPEGLSRLLRVMYSARSLLHAAGIDDIAPRDEPMSTSRANGSPREGDLACNDLSSALTAIRGLGIERAQAPRALVETLQSPGGCGPVASMLLAPGGAGKDLVRALTGHPYLLDPAELTLALQSVQAGMDVRETLAQTIGSLPGGRPREAAVAAVEALDAASREPNDAACSAVAVRSVDSAMREFACGHGEYFSDAHYAELLDAATQADAVWAAVSERAPLAGRLSSVVDGIVTVTTDEGVALTVDAGGQARAQIVFGERRPDDLTWRMIASSLGVPDAPQCTAERRFWIAQDVAHATSQYLECSLPAAFAPASAAYAWPSVETQVVFTAPPMTFSASRLNAYVKCPRRWFFDYLCHVLDDPSSLQAAYGSVIHDALESFHRTVRVPSRYDPAVLLERLVRELDTAFGDARDAFPSQLEYEVSRARARRIAEHYVRWLAAESARSPMHVEHVELMQRLTLGGHEFIGYIDRIDRPLDGGAVTILDYKTGRIDADAGAYLAKVRSGDEAQLALYYAMRTASGDEVRRIALVSVRDPKDEVWILALDIDGASTSVNTQPEDGILRARCSPADLEASLDALVARCDSLTKTGQAHFAIGADPPCGYCAYYGACRERPGKGERIFAR